MREGKVDVTVRAALIEELFALARERRLLVQTQESEELECHDGELNSRIAGIPEDAREAVIRDLIIAMDAVSHSYQQFRTTRR